jgi:hypothetical protein
LFLRRLVLFHLNAMSVGIGVVGGRRSRARKLFTPRLLVLMVNRLRLLLVAMMACANWPITVG